MYILFGNAGLDFNSSSHFVTIQSDTYQVTLDIEIVQDELTELEEVFLLMIRNPAMLPDLEGEVCVSLSRSLSLVRIKMPCKLELHMSERANQLQ